MVSGFFIVLALNLTNLTVAAYLHNFETIDLTLNGAGGAGTLKLDRNAIINVSDLLDNPATSGLDESQMLVVNGKAGDTLQLVDSGSWNTVTTGLRGADLNNTYGADYNFTPADLYIQLRNNGVTLFIFVAPRT